MVEETRTVVSEDGRGVVSEHSSAEAGGDGRHQILGVLSRADADGDGDEEGEGSPGGAGGEGESHADEEDDGGMSCGGMGEFLTSVPM